MTDDLERNVRAAIEEAVYPLHGHSGGWRISDRVVPVVVRLIEEERAGLVERLNREAENHAACDDQTRGIIAGLRERAEKAEAERDEAHNGECGTCDGYHSCCDAADGVQLQRAEAAVARVRALHFEYRGPTDPDSCAHCNQLAGHEIRYPCPTIAALDGPTP